MRVTTPFHYPTEEPLALTDLNVKVHYGDEIGAAVATPDLALEALAALGDGWYRLTGVPSSLRPTSVVATLANDPGEILLVQTWESRVEEEIILGLFQTPGSGGRVTYTFLDQATDGVSGIHISVWTADLTTPVIPRLTTDTSGKSSFWLPAGSYKVFAYKAFVTFPAQPFAITVSEGADLTPTVSVLTGAPALPTQPVVTLFGWVLRPDLVPVQDVEVKVRVLRAPQHLSGGAGVYKYEVVATTDAQGFFTLPVAGGMAVLVTCDATGYSRQGTLPISGSINWSNFAVATLPEA